jgi:hypothetical protein
MSEAETKASEGGQKRVTELKVSGHLMTLDAGTFCVFHAPGSPVATDGGSGLPGVRLSLPPGILGRPDAVSINTFRDDGWLSGPDAAALIHVVSGPAQVLVTIYQAPGQAVDGAPRLQVLRLSLEGTPDAVQKSTGRAILSAEQLAKAEVAAHVQSTGDIVGAFGEWVGLQGSGNWIEGFSIAPQSRIALDDIEYQAVLGRGWLSPWVSGGQFCGSRGMALPLLGVKVRLKGRAAADYDCTVRASFVDGSEVGPVPVGEVCESENLAPLEAFQIVLTRHGVPVKSASAAKSDARAKSAAKQAAAKSVAKPAAKPVAKSIAKPAAKPLAKPVVKSAAKPVAKPAAKPVAKPAAKPVAKPAAKSVVKPSAKPVAKPKAKPAKRAR